MSVIDHLQFGAALDVWAASRASADPLAHPLENQDNLLLIDATGLAYYLRDELPHSEHLPNWPAGHVRLAVLDGMGGHGHGRQASEAVVAGLLGMPACTSLAELSGRLDVLHMQLQLHFSVGDDDGVTRHPGTTLTMLEMVPGQETMLYHVGDSRLYEILPDNVTPLTVDHVPATVFAMAGMLEEHDWWRQVHGEHRSQISQAFILGNAFTNPSRLSAPLFELHPLNLPPFLYQLADRRALTLRADALYLLASDGFWACANPVDWVLSWPALLSQPGQDARTAIDCLFDQLAHAPPEKLHFDNITAIALRWRPGERHISSQKK